MITRNVFGDAAVMAGLRWSIVLIFALFGTAKFAAYEAAGVASIAGDHPLFSWLYPLLGERGASGAIGIVELLTGAAIATGAWVPRVGLLGGAVGIATFCATLSFSFGAPSFWEAGYGAPFLGSTGQFLVKDTVLMAACAALARDGWQRSQPSAAPAAQ